MKELLHGEEAMPPRQVVPSDTHYFAEEGRREEEHHVR